MSFVKVTSEEGRADVCISRGKVNALNEEVIDELRSRLEVLEEDNSIRAVVLTGTGAFFSFGFDIPALYDLAREDFTRYLTKFTDLISYLFLFPKPVVAALNGHAIAGGCMLATACDHRIMVSGKAKISLNEITFGATVFQSAVEQCRYWVGSRMTQEMLFSGIMYTAEQAQDFGLVQEVVVPDRLSHIAVATARRFAQLQQPAFASLKRLLRAPIVETLAVREQRAITEFVDIWYSDRVRQNLRRIEIRTGGESRAK